MPSGPSPVRYGASIRLRHVGTRGTMRSYPFVSGRMVGSGQDPVTCWDGPDGDDLWRIKGPHGQAADVRRLGVKDREVIRLEHTVTRKNLHSHADYPSPVSNQQEVTAFGEMGVGDEHDNWRLELEGGGDWTTDKPLRLVHVITGRTLASQAGLVHERWTHGQQEVAGVAERAPHDLWTGEVLQNDACFVAQNVPSSIALNSTVETQLTMRNVGLATWSPEAGHRLGSQNPPDTLNWGRNRVELPGPVAPGEEVTITVPLTAPTARGAAVVQWRLLQEGAGWFGHLTPPVTVNIVLPGGPTSVPDVRGGVKMAAMAAIRAAGLEVRLTGASGKDAIVVSQSPPPHTPVDRGTMVVLHMQVG
jgi:hypothetical protein